MAGQWRVVPLGLGGARVIGLDAAAAQAGFTLAGIEMTPGLWARVRLVASGAIAALNGD